MMDTSTAAPAESAQINTSGPITLLSFGALSLWTLAAVAAFQLAYSFPQFSLAIFAYAFCLLQLARARTTRQSFYAGLAVGLFAAGPQLNCFWVIFGPGAIALWLILAVWIALFAAIARNCLIRYGPLWGGLLVPFIWTGLEYFRSELYYLRFSWLSVGYTFSGPFGIQSGLTQAYKWIGGYGFGFISMAVAVLADAMRRRVNLARSLKVAGAAVILLGLTGSSSPRSTDQSPNKTVRVAGVQMEFPNASDIVPALDKLLSAQPTAELFVLSEYTLEGPVPDSLKEWCRQHGRYLIVGGKDPAPNDNFYDTAFVVGPRGDIVFRQVKSVPIQFFKDGLPAPEQKLWDSPWGKIGICVCYDLSYTRVTDRLIRLGAQALIVPTMDVVNWGKREHELHGRVAPVRAAEYGVPIVRVASSGISQIVDSSGRVTTTASFPGESESLVGDLIFGNSGSLPLDRWLGPFASGLTGIVVISLIIRRKAFRT
jgi:apolipoprotein N-acyltransferase